MLASAPDGNDRQHEDDSDPRVSEEQRRQQQCEQKADAVQEAVEHHHQEVGPCFSALLSGAATPPIRRSEGCRRQAAVSSAMMAAMVRWSANVHRSPGGTSRAAVALSTTRQPPCAGKPMTASRGLAQARHLSQVAPV